MQWTPMEHKRQHLRFSAHQHRTSLNECSTPTFPCFNDLCNVCCCCFQFHQGRVLPLPTRLVSINDADGSNNYEMVEMQPRKTIRVIHLVPCENPNNNKGTKKTVYGRNKGNISPEMNDNFNRSTIPDAPSSCTTGCVFPVTKLIVSAEISSKQEIGTGAQTESASFFYEEPVIDDNSFGKSETDFSRKCSVRVYDFESAFHPNNRSIRNVIDNDKQHKLHIYSDRLAHAILTNAFQMCSGSSTEGCFMTTTTDFDFINTCSPFVNLRTNIDVDFANRNSSAEKLSSVNEITNSRNGFYHNPVFQDCEILKDIIYRDKSASNVTVCSNLTSSGFHSLPKRFAGLVNNDTAIISDEDFPPANILDPFENFTYSPSGGDDASSQMGSSFQSSTWGSSTNSSLRYVRRFVPKKYSAKPMLFFIHGIGDSADIWRNQLRFFKHKGYETLAMDLVGHGLSYAPHKSKVYQFHSILSDVIAIFDRYSKERNVAIGHSYGACFAAALARHRSKQVTHLVLLSGGGPFPLCPQPRKLYEPLCFSALVKWWKSSCKSRRRAYCMPSRKQISFVSSLDIPSYVRHYIFKGQIWLEGDASFHKQITVPTLLIYGLRDPFITLVEECEMEKTIPRAFLELIPEASHMLMLDTPNEVNDMIHKFLKRWDR